jgi:hypothetical protein
MKREDGSVLQSFAPHLLLRLSNWNLWSARNSWSKERARFSRKVRYFRRRSLPFLSMIYFMSGRSAAWQRACLGRGPTDSNSSIP